MKRSTFSVLFYARTSKKLKTGEVPIYLRITVDGQRADIAIKRSTKLSIWDSKKNKAKGSSKEARELNDYLQSIIGQLYTHHQLLQEAGSLVTASSLKNAFLGRGEKQRTLCTLFKDHNNDIKRLIGKEYSKLTWGRYEATLAHIIDYMHCDYNVEDIPLEKINHQFIAGFEIHLKTVGSCQHNAAMKHIKNFKKVIKLALANEFLKKDPFLNFKITTKQVDRVCLTKQELNRIAELQIDCKRLDVIRDLFLFQCYTGLSYVDLAALTPNHINLGIDGNKWIFTKRGKTNTPCHIPLLPIAEQIMEKYVAHSCRAIKKKLLPVPSNQKYNAYLKEVAILAEVKKNLHTHLARHTYATTVTLSNGMPLETVSKLLGHRRIQTTQIYAKVLDNKVSEEMELLKQKLAG